jgi:D-glycero-D-manno-heptose 1,7-bisphosphate phosphatase
MNKAVFLDRDGVINRTIIKDGRPYAPRTLDDFHINPDIQQLSRLKKLGYYLIIVTNQPDVADQLVPRAFVDDLHARLRKTFPFDDIIACFHNDKDNCDCRKPKPGMLLQARDKFNIDVAGSYMIGDRWRDVLAGQAAGCTAIFIDHGYMDNAPAFHPDFICGSLVNAIEWIESR